MTTKIEWTDETWNPVTGCTPISPGCKNCYAKRMALRLAGRYGYPENEPFMPGTYHEDKINLPFEWKKPKKIFVCSMGDLFHEDVPEWQIDEVFKRVLHDGISHHTFQVLTKRADRMAEYCNQNHIQSFLRTFQNVWLGVTVESQREDWRINELMKIPAATRFVSVEPMIGPVNLLPPWLRNLDWVVCGGETGPGARDMRPEWAKQLKEECEAVGLPFFMKQMSKKVAIPPYLQGRDFPQGL